MKKPQLIAVTAPNIFNFELDRYLSAEEFISYAARISNPSNQMNSATSQKLLTYLVKNSHWSPFDMVDMIVEVNTSKAIAIQMLRHWSFRFQEFSQRYAKVSTLEYSHVEVRQKHEGGNRQGSSAENPEMTNTALESCLTSSGVYSHLVATGAAPESARMVLPMATLSTLYVKGSVRSWMTYFWQRLDPHAQKEHRDLAHQIFLIFQKEFPIIAKLVLTHKPTVIENAAWIETQP